MAMRKKRPAARQPKTVSVSERELACARAIIQSPDLHEDATFRAACTLLRTVGIASDRQNAESALLDIELKAERARKEPIDVPTRPKPAELAEMLPAWVKGIGVSAFLLTIVTVTLLLS